MYALLYNLLLISVFCCAVLQYTVLYCTAFFIHVTFLTSTTAFNNKTLYSVRNPYSRSPFFACYLLSLFSLPPPLHPPSPITLSSFLPSFLPHFMSLPRLIHTTSLFSFLLFYLPISTSPYFSSIIPSLPSSSISISLSPPFSFSHTMYRLPPCACFLSALS